MPDDLLLELERAVPVAKNLDNIEDLLRVLVRQAVEAVESMKGSARAFENVWQNIVLVVAKGETSAPQAARPKLLSMFATRLNQLKHTRAFVASLFPLGRADLADALLSEIEGMERLKARVFDRWQSEDDLEKLAVELYPLSQSRLEKIAATYAPPAEWYQGGEEQLFQE